MKILLISSRFFPFTGGVENVVLNLAKEFKAKGHEVLVIASQMGKAKEKKAQVDGIDVQRVWLNLPRSLLGFLAFPFRFLTGLTNLVRLVSKYNPDIVNYHFPDDSSVYVWLALAAGEAPGASADPAPGAEECGDLFSPNPAPLILNIHGNDLQVFGKKLWYRFFLKKLINRARKIIVNSEYIKEDLTNNFPQAEKKIEIIANGVDQKFFQIGDLLKSKVPSLQKGRDLSPTKSSCTGCPLAQVGACAAAGEAPGASFPQPQRLGNLPCRQAGAAVEKLADPQKLASLSPYILYLGRLVPKKGVDTLIKAYAKVEDELNSNLVIVGDGTSRKELEKLVKVKNLEEKISFVGFKSGIELLQYIQNANFTIIPSYREPFGIVALELAAAGKPIIASKTGGLAEILEDGKTALLFETKNAEELAEEMIRLEKNAELRRNLAENAKEMAKGYRWEAVAETYLETFQGNRSISRSAEKSK
ncbi:MAG: glycosyltransferase family 4 protein [Patescibacteria group bacterium]|nr:glycosyltransferase family 4 protein [Patescibacteria group bacterium]